MKTGSLLLVKSVNTHSDVQTLGHRQIMGEKDKKQQQLVNEAHQSRSINKMVIKKQEDKEKINPQNKNNTPITVRKSVLQNLNAQSLTALQQIPHTLKADEPYVKETSRHTQKKGKKLKIIEIPA